jgi:hypothetical protein
MQARIGLLLERVDLSSTRAESVGSENFRKHN